MNNAGFFAKYWLPPLLWAALIFALSSIPSLESGLPGPWDFALRKLGHMIEYAILTVLLARALRAHGWLLRRALLWSALLAIAYAVGDEYHQSFVAGREGSLRDVLIDGVGVLAVMGFWNAQTPSRSQDLS
jgi:VanZ family protein